MHGKAAMNFNVYFDDATGCKLSRRPRVRAKPRMPSFEGGNGLLGAEPCNGRTRCCRSRSRPMCRRSQPEVNNSNRRKPTRWDAVPAGHLHAQRRCQSSACYVVARQGDSTESVELTVNKTSCRHQGRAFSFFRADQIAPRTLCAGLTSGSHMF